MNSRIASRRASDRDGEPRRRLTASKCLRICGPRDMLTMGMVNKKGASHTYPLLRTGELLNRDAPSSPGMAAPVEVLVFWAAVTFVTPLAVALVPLPRRRIADR